MCGIFGCVLKEGVVAAPRIKAALKKLEYRGYDSAGVATVYDGRLFVKKDVGKIEAIDRKLSLDELPGAVGIGHTRWATHGAPSTVNSHPHTDCQERIAVAHNGIIENFLDLRKRLEERGHEFKSRTDTEVIPHLLEEWIAEGKGIVEAVQNTVRELRGSFAIVVVFTGEPDRIVCARKESPLVVGLSEGGNYVASDIPAFLDLTKSVLYLEEGEVAVLSSDSVEIVNLASSEVVTREPVEVTWSAEMAEKGGYDYFMLKEIHEQPLSLKNVLRTQDLYYQLMAEAISKASQVLMVACGTSYHACLAASYMFNHVAKTNVQPVVASEFKERFGEIVDRETVVIAVSQSGETADTLGAVRWALERGAVVLSVTNVMGSSLTRLSSVYIGQNSGPEIGVAATKTFTAQLMVLAKLAAELGERTGKLPLSEKARILKDLESVPTLVGKTIEMTEMQVMSLARRMKDAESFCFLGRGLNSVTAMEGRLKLLELSYIPSLAYPAGESKHGFIAVVDEDYPVVFVAPKDQTYSKTIGNIMEMKARGAKTILVVEEDDTEASSISDITIRIPRCTEVTSPMISIVPLQLLALYMAVCGGHDPDKPRNLAKSVTVE